MKNKELLIFGPLVFLIVGFAVVHTSLDGRGSISLGFNERDFDVRFSKAVLNGEDIQISDSGQRISFSQSIDDVTLEYEIENNSSNYDADLDVVCSLDYQDEEITMTNTLDKESVAAHDKTSGSVDVKIPYYRSLYNTIIKDAVDDNKPSEFVTSLAGINYGAISSDTNGKGIYRLASMEEEGDTPVYFYRGDIDNNHVLYARFCWKIVRTTETGGIKLVYNGEPSESGSCASNTGDSSLIGSDKFNIYNSIPSYSGYMYGYIGYENKGIVEKQTMILSQRASNMTGKAYGIGVSYNNETKKYSLDNVEYFTDGADPSKLVGKYSYFSDNASYGVDTVHYITKVVGDIAYYYDIVLGEKSSLDVFDNYYYIRQFASSYSINEDGTFTLNNPIHVRPENWYNDYSKYNNWYVCGNLETTCDNLYQIRNNETIMSMFPVAMYADDFIYVDNNFQLKDPVLVDWSDNYSNLNRYRYTCLTGTDSCSDIYYVFFADNDYVGAFKYHDNLHIEDISELINENKTNSTIKSRVDAWYEQNILGRTFSNYLEDTVWCNDRKLLNDKTWFINNAPLNFPFLEYNAINYEASPTDGYKCFNVNDSFTVDLKNGNGALKYPIGLLTSNEVTFAGSGIFKSNASFYLQIGVSWFTMTPWHVKYFSSRNVLEAKSLALYAWGYLVDYSNNVGSGIRPSVSLKNDVLYSSGDGTGDNPYVISGLREHKDYPSSVNVTCDLNIRALERNEYVLK